MRFQDIRISGFQDWTAISGLDGNSGLDAPFQHGTRTAAQRRVKS
jgi:hypothetical protein